MTLRFTIIELDEVWLLVAVWFGNKCRECLLEISCLVRRCCWSHWTEKRTCSLVHVVAVQPGHALLQNQIDGRSTIMMGNHELCFRTEHEPIPLLCCLAEAHDWKLHVCRHMSSSVEENVGRLPVAASTASPISVVRRTLDTMAVHRVVVVPFGENARTSTVVDHETTRSSRETVQPDQRSGAIRIRLVEVSMAMRVEPRVLSQWCRNVENSPKSLG